MENLGTIGILQIKLLDNRVTQDDVLKWLKIISFAKQNKWCKIELQIEDGVPSVGLITPSVNFKHNQK